MPDAEPDDTSDDVPDDAEQAAAPPGPHARLVALQGFDSRIDVLGHRRAHLPEADALAEAVAALRSWEAARDRLERRIGELADAISAAEVRADDLTSHTTRLQAQLKTVIAPREAEALMHEIQTLETERDDVETKELEALEEQTEVEAALVTHLTAQDEHRAAVDAAQATLDAATSAIDAEIAQLTPDRDAARDGLDAAVLSRYERLRSHDQVAVAHLDGSRCSGCHLDLSAAEVDDVKDEAAASGGIADCPQCGRMLVI